MDIVTVMDPWQCIKILSPKRECERVTVIHAQVPIAEDDCTIYLMGENQKFLHYTVILRVPPLSYYFHYPARSSRKIRAPFAIAPHTECSALLSNL
jgi:hypothetical protein